MKTCLIPPVPDLERFVTPAHDHHLVLAHLLDNLTYFEFYKKRAFLGDYVILDNGAKELGHGLGLPYLLDRARALGAKEVVLTDVRYDRHATLEAAREQLQWLVTIPGRLAYEAAGNPRLMIVPQGGSPKEWHQCLDELLLMTSGVLELIDNFPRPAPVVSVAYHYDHMFEPGQYHLMVRDLIESGHEVHLLGWTRRLATLYEVATSFPNRIRSVDSSRPFVYATRGWLAEGSSPEYPGRRSDYFERPLPEQFWQVALNNVSQFARYAKDWDVLEVNA